MDEKEEDVYRDMLESKRFDIVQNLQVQKTFVFDYLRSKGVLDSEDCELIQSEKTTSLKIGKFVDILARKGPDGYHCLLESLQLENPKLYETLTGEEACATTSPILRKLKNSYLGEGDPLGNGELEILSKHLERTYGDLYAMSHRFEKVVQGKKCVEERLEMTISDLERKQEKVEHLEKQIINSGKSSSANPQANSGKWLQCVETLRKGNSDRDIYIIALQTKLMSTKEELEEMQKKNEYLHNNGEELRNVINEICQNYKKKKCESMRLSERIRRQGDEIRKAEETMRKYRESQFQIVKLREDRDTVTEELRQLHKWTNALKTRFDIVESEKEKTLTSQTEIIADFGSVQDELEKCKEEMSEVQCVATDLRERVRHLERDRQAYKKQREWALTARREAVLDRDKAFLERDQALKKYNEIKESSEERLENAIFELKSYDESVARNDVLEEEVKQVKVRLREKERQLEEMRLEEGNQDMQGDSEMIVPEIAVVSEDAKPDENEDDGQCPTTELLTSIKRRVNKAPNDFCSNSFLVESDEFPVFSAFLQTNADFPDMGAGIYRDKVTRKPCRDRRKSKEKSETKGDAQPPKSSKESHDKIAFALV